MVLGHHRRTNGRRVSCYFACWNQAAPVFLLSSARLFARERSRFQILRPYMRINRRRAFTLVELLVVIAIIALLIAVLLPVLGRAKESANRSVCLSNHKQILLAISFYANDNKGYLPHCNWLGQETTAGVPGWLYDSKVAPDSKGFKTEDALKGGALWRYIRNVK